MIITITIDVLLIELMGISSVTCMCLTPTPKEATTVRWAIMTCPLIDEHNTFYLYRTDYDL